MIAEVTADPTVLPSLLSPVVQYGFAGVCVILLGILVFGGKWLFKHLFELLGRNQDVITNNTVALTKVNESQEKTLTFIQEVRDWLLQNGRHSK